MAVCRAFLNTLLPTFKQENPHLAIEEKPRPGHHPYFLAEYREHVVLFCLEDAGAMRAATADIKERLTLQMHAGNGNVRTVGVKNQSEEDILRQAVILRSSAGRNTHVKVSHCAQALSTFRVPVITGQEQHNNVGRTERSM